MSNANNPYIVLPQSNQNVATSLGCSLRIPEIQTRIAIDDVYIDRDEFASLKELLNFLKEYDMSIQEFFVEVRDTKFKIAELQMEITELKSLIKS